jgi:AcrR family transcriptional regulator
MSTKDALLDVTARLFAEHGWRGTTTRRIAEAAGVNEVTVFRHFGSKAALLAEAIHRQAAEELPTGRLPERPGDLREELAAWSTAHHRHMRTNRSLIRTCLAEFEEHPEIAPVAAGPAMESMADLVRYLVAAREGGLIGPDGSLEAAAVMLMNALFMDAITRDVIPGCPVSDRDAIGFFVDLILRALRAKELM